MRIAVVGPTHPIKGGVAQHTTVLAQRLVAAGHEVQIVSWRRQYPQRLYPGQQTVEQPEFEPFEPTSRALSWNRPDSWVRAAWRLREVDLVVFAHITPVQVIPYRTMIATICGGRARTAVICHNVLPHERGRADAGLVSLLLRGADLIVVHSESQAAEASRLTGKPIRVAQLAPFMPTEFVRRVPLAGEHRRLIFFGLVRPYKGLDVLLRALAAGPSGVRLRVVGEFWGGTGSTLELCHELGIADRVELRDGYVAAAKVPGLFSDVDALVLPYRNATGSQGVWTGFEFGVPVIATRAGHLADGIREGVDGVVAEPDEVESLACALRTFYTEGVPERMRAAVTPVDPKPYWDRYLDTLTATGGAKVRRGSAAATRGFYEKMTPKGRRKALMDEDALGPRSVRVISPLRWGPRSADRYRASTFTVGSDFDRRELVPITTVKDQELSQIAAPPGGRLLHLAKLGAEQVLWARVATQRMIERRRGHTRPLPKPTLATDVLKTTAEYESAVQECRALRLPLHRDRPKNWDALGAVSIVLNTLGTDIQVLDAGAARYSSVLPWLRLYNVRELVGNNLEFTRVIRHGGVRFEPGDATATQYRAGWFDAVTCMSVIEHGVPLEAFLAESARILRPGGLLVVSTDYDQEPPETLGKFAYGVQVKIFGPDDIKAFVESAKQFGLELNGELALQHPERPVHWPRTGLDYTFILLSFTKVADDRS